METGVVCYKIEQNRENKEKSNLLSLEKNTSPLLKSIHLFLLKFSSKHTQKTYKRALFDFLSFWQAHHKPLYEVEKILRHHIDVFQRHLEAKYPPNTVAAKLSALLSFLNFAFENEWITKNVGANIKLPKISKTKGKTEAFSEEELTIILQKLKADFENALEPTFLREHKTAWLRYVLFVTLCTVGMRASELVNLRICDFETLGQFPRLNLILKGGQENSILIPEELAALLKEYLMRLRKWARPEAPFFTTDPYFQKPLARESVSRMIAQIAKECGIAKNVSSHTCNGALSSAQGRTLIRKFGRTLFAIIILFGRTIIAIIILFERMLFATEKIWAHALCNRAHDNCNYRSSSIFADFAAFSIESKFIAK